MQLNIQPVTNIHKFFSLYPENQADLQIENDAQNHFLIAGGGWPVKPLPDIGKRKLYVYEMNFVMDNDKTPDVEARVHFTGKTGISVDMTKIEIPYELFIQSLRSRKDQ